MERFITKHLAPYSSHFYWLAPSDCKNWEKLLFFKLGKTNHSNVKSLNKDEEWMNRIVGVYFEK